MLLKYGKISCKTCFKDKSNSTAQPHPDWQMSNDPGAWGGNTPEYLILGFSKGSTQKNIYETGRFEDVPFAGMRNRLTQALRVLNVLPCHETVDKKISDRTCNIAFGSLIRCSVARREKKAVAKSGSEVFACTGALINKSFKEIPDVISNCAQNFLQDLPTSVHTVLFLGNGDAYVKNCQALLNVLFPNSFERINAMVVQADGKIWANIAHPSGLNGHFNTWLSDDTGPGLKRQMVQEVLNSKPNVNHK